MLARFSGVTRMSDEHREVEHHRLGERRRELDRLEEREAEECGDEDPVEVPAVTVRSPRPRRAPP